MQIEATVVAHSVTQEGKEIISFEWQYPRLIHSEIMTHRVLSKNCASSRAIPVKTVIEMVKQSPAMPVHWGKNQAGMCAREELDVADKAVVQQEWLLAMDDAVRHAQVMADRGAHKGVINRILEPFQWMKTLITGTEWVNFFWLRDHEDADPTLRALAKATYKAYKASQAIILKEGEWHLPYYQKGFWKPNSPSSLYDVYGNTLDDALKVSVSCAAQTSYRKTDDTLGKAKRVFDMLNIGNTEGKPVHASPTEHQATPIPILNDLEFWGIVMDDEWPEGVTAYHRDLGLMSGNLAGWIQYRSLIPNNTKWGSVK